MTKLYCPKCKSKTNIEDVYYSNDFKEGGLQEIEIYTCSSCNRPYFKMDCLTEEQLTSNPRKLKSDRAKPTYLTYPTNMPPNWEDNFKDKEYECERCFRSPCICNLHPSDDHALPLQVSIGKEDWLWMPHPGHFICAYDCRFRLNTYVNGFIVSTVGELVLNGKIEEIGSGRLYETMVFKAKKSTHICCPYEAVFSGDNEIDFDGYNTPEEAYEGHLNMCEKWHKELNK